MNGTAQPSAEANKTRPHFRIVVCFAANAVLVTALLPYISPVVFVNMDVQLMALATSIAALLGLLFLEPRLFSFDRNDAVILAIGLICLIYVNPNVFFEDVPTTLRASGQFIAAFPIYYAIRILYRYMSPRVLIGVVILYLIALFAQLWLPGLYSSTFAHMLSDTRFASDEGRGPNGLCTEPSMMGNMCMLFMVSLYFFHREYWRSHKWQAYLVVTMSCVMLLITKSGIGVILSLVVGLVAILSSRLRSVAKICIIAAVLLVVSSLGEALSTSDSRGAVVLSAASADPLSIITEASLAERLSGIYTGIHQLPEKPFGSFNVQVSPQAAGDALNGDLAVQIWPDSGLRSLLLQLRLMSHGNHGISDLSERMGLVGLLIIAYLFAFPQRFQGKWVVRAFLAALFLNATFFIPTLWFVIGSCAHLRRDGEQKQPDMKVGFCFGVLRGVLREMSEESTDNPPNGLVIL